MDAPCSGLGTLSKKPDAKWYRDRTDIDDLALLQQALLENAAKLVKNGGVLVYSTCTTEPEENIQNVRVFLEAHPEFRVENATEFVKNDVVQSDRFVETFPHVHGMDGSFAVRLKKVG